MRYPEEFIGPMRQELTRLGVQETRTPEDVDAMLGSKAGTVLMVINSMCGCAAGRARPGIALALKHAVVPDTVATVFAAGIWRPPRACASICRTIRPPRHRWPCSERARPCSCCSGTRLRIGTPPRLPSPSPRPLISSVGSGRRS
jgi:hypothetical protein